MLSMAALESLSECSIKDSYLTLGRQLPEKEFLELKDKLRAAILTHKIPFYKPIAALFGGIPTLPRVTSVYNGISKTYLGMIPELSYCICMPTEDIETVPDVWVKKAGKDKLEFPDDKMVGARSFGMRSLVYIKSIDDGDVRLSDCCYCLDRDKANGKRIMVRPLLKDCPPIVSIAGNGAFIQLHMVLGMACNRTSCSDVIKTVGNISKNYVQIEQVYGLEEYLLVSPLNVGDRKIKFTYKRDIDEEVLEEIIRRFAKRLLTHFDTSIEQEGTPAYGFCRKSVENIANMWEDS